MKFFAMVACYQRTITNDGRSSTLTRTDRSGSRTSVREVHSDGIGGRFGSRLPTVALPKPQNLPHSLPCLPGMLAYVKRTTVKLPDDLDARLRHEAERRGSTVSELTREAIEAHLGAGSGRRKLIASAAGRSGSHDISVRIEEILRDEASR